MSDGGGALPAPSGRIASMDQFRGYAILGMILVDYFECFNAATPQLHHHRGYMTYADTIAPAFMFVVGMGMRLSFKRRIEKVGMQKARKDLIKRYATLVLIACVIYMHYLWDALMNIGLAGLLAVWVADKKPSVRIAAGLSLLALYQAVFSLTSYGGWLMGTITYTPVSMPLIWKLIPFGSWLVHSNINGGPIGHWSWLLMLLCGTIGYDILETANPRKILLGALGCGLAFAAAGWALHLPWPGVKAEWVFSKYHMTAPYALWASALCFFTMAAFYVFCDVLRLRIPTLTVLGMNPLFIYILLLVILGLTKWQIPRNTHNWAGILAGFALLYGICYGTAYYMYRKKIFVKL